MTPPRARLHVLMGVSGCGKSHIGSQLSSTIGWPFLEGDAFHPAENIEKMSSGHPLTNVDREGWIARIGEEVRAMPEPDVLLACSALNPQVRDWIVTASGRECQWIVLDLTEDQATERVQGRATHFMPATLVQSQFAAFDPPESGIRVDASLPSAEVCRVITKALGVSIP